MFFQLHCCIFSDSFTFLLYNHHNVFITFSSIFLYWCVFNLLRSCSMKFSTDKCIIITFLNGNVLNSYHQSLLISSLTNVFLAWYKQLNLLWQYFKSKLQNIYISPYCWRFIVVSFVYKFLFNFDCFELFCFFSGFFTYLSLISNILPLLYLVLCYIVTMKNVF